MAGRDLLPAQRVQPEPLSQPTRESTALNPEAADLVKPELKGSE